MIRERVQKSSERSSQSQESAMAPVLTQRHSPSPHTQQDTETQVNQQHNREAAVLKIQAKYGTITPQGQERLTFLQAKMADDTQRKLDIANRTHQNISNSSSGDVSVAPPERNTASPIQAKLTIGQPGDKYEQEADRVAAQVVNQIHAPTTQREALPEEDELQMKPAIGSIQRQTMSEQLQMKSSGAAMTVPQDLETSIQQARGSGQPLADEFKQPMEQEIGDDLGEIKIHTDAQSHQLNQSIQARAFTTTIARKPHIFFRQGEYNPNSRKGKLLLNHELAHAAQQKGGELGRKSLPDQGIKKNKIQAEVLLNSPSGNLPVIQRGLFDKAKDKLFSRNRDGDRIEEIVVNGENWKRYMELEMLNMNVDKFSRDKQFGHGLMITIRWYNKSQKRLNLMTPPPLVYFEEITTTNTTNGNRVTNTESVDQYERNPRSNTFLSYRWGTEGKIVEPGERLQARFIDPPQITKTQEYKSRTVKFKIGLRGSGQWLTGVQQLSCENNEIIEHVFTRP